MGNCCCMANGGPLMFLAAFSWRWRWRHAVPIFVMMRSLLNKIKWGLGQRTMGKRLRHGEMGRVVHLLGIFD